MNRLTPALLLVLVLSLPGCATLRQFAPAVELAPMSPAEYIAVQRGDRLTTGKLSALTLQSLRVAGLDEDACVAGPAECISALEAATGPRDERWLSAVAELWLHIAMGRRDAGVEDDAQLQAWMEVARHAYGYLFFGTRTPGERAFEDRQVQLRDWYNYATQEAVALLFEAGRRAAAEAGGDTAAAPAGEVARAGWRFRIDLSGIRMPEGVSMPQELLPASSLSFTGLRSTWRRDGFGAELVAVMEDDPVATAGTVDPVEAAQAAEEGAQARRRPGGPRAPAWSEMPSPGLTVLLRFEADDLAGVLAQREVLLSAHDPYAESEIAIHGLRVPMAANFTAGYGLWLARSGFNRQSLRTLFGRERGIDRPHLYMMQPYDPQRRIILMLHGLASSPEAWVNVANEIQGDEQLRARFQIWQVYYPTNAPLVLNHVAIRNLVSRTLAHFDPSGTTLASQGIVLVGHSMGGVLGRLMVSSADDQLWTWAEREYDPDPQRLARVRHRIDPMLRFAPFTGIDRAIFIASPHRGTAVAGNRLGRWIAGLVRLPLTVLEGVGDVLQALGDPDGAGAEDGRGRLPNSIDNLDERDPFVRAAADLPMAPGVRTHSIIARLDPDGPLEDTDDGLVPYRSAHLPQALSEKVIEGGHSVQETPAAILEIRRILHQDLRERGQAVPPRDTGTAP